MSIVGNIIRTKKRINPSDSPIKSETLVTSYLVILFNNSVTTNDTFTKHLRNYIGENENIEDTEDVIITLCEDDSIRIRIENTMFKTTIYKSINLRFFKETDPFYMNRNNHKGPRRINPEGLFHKYYTFKDLNPPNIFYYKFDFIIT